MENWREIRLHQCPDQSQVHQSRGQATAVHWEYFAAINEERLVYDSDKNVRDIYDSDMSVRDIYDSGMDVKRYI